MAFRNGLGKLHVILIPCDAVLDVCALIELLAIHIDIAVVEIDVHGLALCGDDALDDHLV